MLGVLALIKWLYLQNGKHKLIGII